MFEAMSAVSKVTIGTILRTRNELMIFRWNE